MPHSFPLGLLAFKPIPFTNSFLWAPLAHFCFLSIFHDSHRLATLFFGASLAHLLSLELLCYFADLWTIILAIWGSMVFTLLFSFHTFFHIVGLLLPLGHFAKNGHQQSQTQTLFSHLKLKPHGHTLFSHLKLSLLSWLKPELFLFSHGRSISWLKTHGQIPLLKTQRPMAKTHAYHLILSLSLSSLISIPSFLSSLMADLMAEDPRLNPMVEDPKTQTHDRLEEIISEIDEDWLVFWYFWFCVLIWLWFGF